MIGILGGTFDPIHNGHLYIAETLYKKLHLQEVRFIPCKNPLLGKKVIATAGQRLEMLQRAILPFPYFSIDECELKRETPSYTIDTLILLRQKFPQVPLALILGNDNLIHLNHWHKWIALIQYAHLVIVPRSKPLYPESFNNPIQTFIKKFQVQDSSLLLQQPAGLLLMTHVKPFTISATAIRAQLAMGLQPTDLPSSVLAYILEQKLYL